MAEEKQGPFREKSLERLSSPERLDQLLQVVDQRSWLPLAVMGALLLALLLWSVLGTVPVNVEGRGILIRPRGVVEIHAPGAGYVERWNVAVNDEVSKGDVLGLIARPDLRQQLEQQQYKLRELTALSQASQILELQRSGVAPETIGSDAGPESHIEASTRVAENLLDRGRQIIGEERTSLEKQLRLARAHVVTAEKQLEGQKELLDQKLVSPEQLMNTEESTLDAHARVASLEADLLALRTRELEIEEQFHSRLQRIADLRMQMQGHEQQMADVERQIRRLELQLEREGRIVTEQGGRILEVSFEPGEFLKAGDRLGAMTVGDQNRPLKSVTYFTVRDGKRVPPEAVIRITPDTVERQRYGSILGQVESVSDFPVTLDEAANLIGNRGVAEALTSGGYNMAVLAILEPDEETVSRLAWTSSAGPDMSFSAGTTTTARVAVERRRPITFVLPFLKSILGVD